MYAAYVGQPVTEESMTWSGWDAALIKSKQRKAKQKVPPNDHDQNSLDEDTLKTAKKVKVDGAGTSECMDTYGLLPYDPKMEQHCKRGEALREPKALRYGQWHIAVCDKRCDPLLLTIAKAVAYATELVKDHIKWNSLQKLLSPHLYDKLQVNLSSSITKFVLSVFEMEDFATGIRTKVRDDSIQSLLQGLQTKFVPAGDWEFLDQTKFVKNQRISMEVIAGWEDKGFQYGCLEGLYEQDIVCMLMHHVRPAADASLPCDACDTKQVVEAMASFVPLKVDSKMQLTLELSRGKCYSVLDYLFVEVCKGFLSEELVEALNQRLRDMPVRNVPVTALSVLSKLVSEVQHGLYELAKFKSMMILYSQTCATFPLREGPFGVFSDEVIEVVKIADLERRAQGHRFIGVHDILFSLLHSRVGDHELVRSVFSKSSPLETPEIPPYRIYKLAGDYAKRCGGKVNLEHLVWAVTTVIKGKECIPVKSITLRDSVAVFPCLAGLGDMNTLPLVESWKDDALELRSKPITDCESLVQAIIDGIPLPNNKFRVEEEETNS